MEVKILAANEERRREKLRVAAYARVSNKDERPEHSLAAQIEHYTELICKNESWSFAGIYSDGFITGTDTLHRHGFCQLIKDCECGRIDVILCKSVSRFSRNTVDLLRFCRYLSSMGIDVRFEKEGIATISEEGEVMLSLLASFAQEESRSISENIKWGIRKGFESGKGTHYRLYGYVYDGGEYRAVPEQAQVIRRIYGTFLAGGTAEQLEKAFNKEGIAGPAGGDFKAGTIRRILSNITYTGNTVYQREYIEDHISHRRMRNNGELAKYMVIGSHPVIVPQKLYDAVQAEIERRRERGHASGHFQSSWHTRKLYCGECGAPLRYISKAGKDGARRAGSFVCSRKSKHGASACPSRQVPESAFKDAVSRVLHIPEFSEEAFSAVISKMTAYSGQLLHFELTDGSESNIIWKGRFDLG